MHQRKSIAVDHGGATTVDYTTTTSQPPESAAPYHHHHHAGGAVGTVPSNNGAPSPKAVRRKRRKAPRGDGLRKLNGSKGLSVKQFCSTFLGTLEDDTLITCIQVISLSILLWCTLTLTGRWLYGSSDGASSHSLLAAIARHFDVFGTAASHPQLEHGRYPKKYLPPSRVYDIPGTMSHIGDKTDSYALLRKDFDNRNLAHATPQVDFTPMAMLLGEASSNSGSGASLDDAAQQAQDMNPSAYDIYNCPDEPPEGYPFHWKLLDVLTNWPPDDPAPRPKIYQGLCVFDYQKDLEKAITYREAEVPFVVQNDPEVMAAADRWNSPGYLNGLLSDVKHRAEYSENNHFLYWNKPPTPRNNAAQQQNKQKRNGYHGIKTPKDWAQPTEMIRMTYDQWLEKANVTDDSLLGPDQPHWYFRLIGCGETGPEGQCDRGSSEYLFDELTFFQPKKNLYMVEPAQQKGIHCRFGMKGVIAENHFDGSRNMIAVLGGERRYILSHPSQCEFLSLLPKGHPSARHSAIDWSDPDLESFPEFQFAYGNEVVLQAGDVLYLPTNWFHYIISLSLNYQCNTRSGLSQEYMKPIHECGF